MPAKPNSRVNIFHWLGRTWRRTRPGFLLTAQIVLPVLIAVQVTASPSADMLRGIGQFAFLVAFTAFLVPIGIWAARWMLVFPIGAVAYSFLHLTLFDLPDYWLPKTWEAWIHAASVWLPCAVFAALAWRVWSGLRRHPGPEVILSIPLPRGEYLVVQGGRNGWVNHHHKLLDEAGRSPVRGQAFGIDIIRPTRGRGMAEFLSGLCLSDESFGTPVLAPAAATVLAVQDGFLDAAGQQMDPANPMGNHVWLRLETATEPVQILLAHLKHQSVCVIEGQTVEPGQQIGVIGNSGNTTRSHLHVHAQRLSAGTPNMDADPLPIAFADQGSPVRNKRLSVA